MNTLQKLEAERAVLDNIQCRGNSKTMALISIKCNRSMDPVQQSLSKESDSTGSTQLLKMVLVMQLNEQ